MLQLHSFNQTKKFEKHDLNLLVDELYSMNYANISDNERNEYIILSCSLISPSESTLAGKFCQIIMKLIENVKLNNEVMLIITNWCTDALNILSDIFCSEILTVLELIFKTNLNIEKQVIDNILKILKHPLEKKSKLVNSDEILIQRLNCISALIPSMNVNHVHIAKNAIVQLIQSDIILNNSARSQILLIQLEVLQKLSEKSPSMLSNDIGIILGISLAFTSYNLPHHVESVPQYLLPTPLLHPEGKTNMSKAGSKTKNRRKQKKITTEKINSAPFDDFHLPEVNWSQTSESDLSDSEISKIARLKKCERKIRLTALSLLLTIVKLVDKKELIGYWNNILDGPYSILKTLSADMSPRSRVSIVTVLYILFSTGKLYISQALHAGKSSNLSYVSWFHLLADLIESSHEVLCNVITQSQSVISTLSILQCLTILVRNTPYHRMKDGILKKVLYSINSHLRHADCNVRVAAIKCLVEIVILEPNTEEQILLIRSNELHPMKDSWIISYFLESVQNKTLAVTVRAECWSLLGCLAKYHFINIISDQRLQQIINIIRSDLGDNNVVIQQKSAKAFEQIAIPIGSLGGCCGVVCYDVWLSLLEGPLVSMLQSTSGSLVSAAADCLATMTISVFEQLPEKFRIFIMTVLCGCVGHEEHSARAAAVRTLGTIVVFPFLSQDIQIIYDVADRIVTALKDENLSVRTKAAWALGNLSDVLVNGSKIGMPIKEVSLLNVLEKAIQTGYDHEKVKACSMRAIGNLMLIIDEKDLQMEDFKQLTTEAAKILVHNASNENNMKVRWNSCYALGNMLKNTLLTTHVKSNWQTEVFNTLSHLIVTCSNFKVRQAAASALSVVTDKQLYGDHYQRLWPLLMVAFENSQKLSEFSEYKHQRNLIDQLCMTFCHLCLLINADDLHYLSAIIEPQLSSCQEYIRELKIRNIEAKAKFDEALEHFESVSQNQLNSEQRATVSMMKELLCVRCLEEVALGDKHYRIFNRVSEDDV